jgi:hypothetical protein
MQQHCMGLASGLRLVPTRLYGRHLQLVATNLQLCSEILHPDVRIPSSPSYSVRHRRLLSTLMVKEYFLFIYSSCVPRVRSIMNLKCM